MVMDNSKKLKVGFKKLEKLVTLFTNGPSCILQSGLAENYGHKCMVVYSELSGLDIQNKPINF